MRLGIIIVAGIIFTSCNFASAQATQPGPTRIKLWQTAPGIVTGVDNDTDPTEPTMDIYLPAGATGPTAAFVVLPGGGYVHLSTIREGSDIAKMLNSHGIAAFVVRYRHGHAMTANAPPQRYQFPVPLWDAQRAIRTVRTNSAEYNVDPHRIGIMGFSAGGHLAAMVAVGIDPGKSGVSDAIDSASARPDFAVLMYPVMTFTQEEYVHKGSRTALTNDDPKVYSLLSPDEHVSANTPPTFLAQGSADRVVPPMNSILFYEACLKNHVPAELHLFYGGGHGFALDPTDPAIRVWPELMINWMTKNKWLPAPAATN
ncbi:MAG: alpha/beta hydrolase [Tepidisphaeraceae bacterium]|jgi:acetyl esterase/lipase